ncbi:acyl carrier protein [Kordiimonas aestuarii]|uniref:acyl carrier protein n=1 Tax=Kordiimonas aestuarii TaxID=1005925 RepID=UPI0021D2D9B2|nr:acyl carrier protein [Kordiimonas aestuarii]
MIERIGVPAEDVTENSVFIKLGLESIDAVLVSGEVEDEFGVELSPSAIFDHETLGGFTAEVVRLMEAQ